MRRTTLPPLGLVLLLLLAPLAGAAAPPAARAPSGPPVQGRVLGSGGAPLAGAKVALLPYEGERERGERRLAGKTAPGPMAQAESGAEGGFTLAAPEAGFWTLRVEAAGHVAQERDLLPLVEAVELEAVELARDRPLAVEVVGADGQPVEGAWVEAAPAGGDRFRGLFGDPRKWRPAARLLRRAAPGPLSLPRGQAERLTVRAFAPGFREAQVEMAAARKTVTLTLAAAGPAVAFEARDAAGRPVAGALLLGGEGRWPLGLTAGDGRLRVPPPVAEGKEVHAL
ncbi:MAG TPA: carboxypeptidase-like regulatory domain-containing protein, partial [Thermoanaerobaculia bacterium]|nr:carboxypeptidase-like regulatory domain-containing protein [Thermoanaerobaculia bacterium]